MLGEILKGPFTHERFCERHARQHDRYALLEKALDVRVVKAAALDLRVNEPVGIRSTVTLLACGRTWWSRYGYGRH